MSSMCRWLGLACCALALGCSAPDPAARGSVERRIGEMQEENLRRMRQIAESSREMEEERRRVLERARAPE